LAPILPTTTRCVCRTDTIDQLVYELYGLTAEETMKLSVEFPSVSYREGPAAVASLARAIERISRDASFGIPTVVRVMNCEEQPCSGLPLSFGFD